MISRITSVLTVLALSSLQGVLATVSPDATCGLNNNGAGYTCLGSSYGNCCSQNGWCGSTSAYCGTGCQSKYGSCTGSGGSSAPSAFTACLTSKNVPVSYSTTSNYSQLAKPYNLRLAYSPAAIVSPTTQQEVADTVVCAAQSSLKVQAKSGGHSYASFSSGGQNGSVVIDLENFQTIKVDASGVATVGAGVRLGNLALGIYNQSSRALPHGTCPGVGIGGHFTHGGYGYSSRHWGLALDTIIGLDVVLANGTAVHVSNTAHSDLFYALRGAAESFGIVTTFYLQTQQAPTSVTYWSFQFPGLLNNPTQAANAMLHLQDWAQNASVVDSNLGGMGVYLDATPTFKVSGVYFGDVATFTSKVQPELLRTLPAPATSPAPIVKAYGWIDSLRLLADPQPLEQPVSGYQLHDDFYAKSLVVPQATPFTSAGLTSYFNYILKNLSNGISWFSIINLYGGAGSQINAVPASSSSYADRSSLWVIQHYGFTGNQGSPFPTTIQPFIAGLNNAITSAQSSTNFTAYLNYVDPSLTPSQAHDLYYGSSVYSKLATLKKQYDPGFVFWNPQAIGTS